MLVAEIATAAGEQAQGVTQVNTALAQMDRIAQSNAASAEQSATAAEQLDVQAANLKQSVERLEGLVGRVDDHGEAAAEEEEAESAGMDGRVQRMARLERAPRVSSQALSRIPMPAIPRRSRDDEDFRRF